MQLSNVCPSCRRTIVSRITHKGIVRYVSSSVTTTVGTVRQEDGGRQKGPSPTETFPRFTNLGISRPHRYQNGENNPLQGRTSQTAITDNSKRELDQLLEDVSEKQVSLSAVYNQFKRFLVRHQPSKQMSLPILLSQHRFPKQFLRELIKQDRLEHSLPTPRQFLQDMVSRGVHDEELWGLVMFEDVRQGLHETAIEVWNERLENHENDHFPTASLMSYPPTDKTFNAVSRPQTTQSSPAVAALTAYLYSRKLSMLTVTLSGLLHFLAPTGEGVTDLIPPTGQIASQLTEHGIHASVIQSTIEDLKKFRPYSDKLNELQSSLLDQVFLAAAHKNLSRIQNLYDRGKKDIVPADPIFYISFIDAFMQCRSKQKAGLVWKDMLGAGIIPSIKTWGSWLDGCAKAKDLELFEEGWNQMKKENEHPDIVCWTIRMQLHFALGDPDSAKQCLQGMLDNHVDINAYAINIAIAGLNSKRMYSDAAELLRWSLKSGIEPDIVTYNLILDSRLRENDFKSVLETLRIMKQTGFAPDVVSYGVILRGLYEHATISPSMPTILGILDEMVNVGIEPSLQFYNTIIHGMLNRFHDISGAIHILAIMPNAGWRASPFTSSIFIQYYAKTSNLRGIESIWSNMHKERVRPDEAIYSSTVAAYARAGMKDQMLYYLGQMVKDHKRPTLTAYILILKCLVNYGDFQVAREVLNEIDASNSDPNGNKELQKLRISVKRSLPMR